MDELKYTGPPAPSMKERGFDSVWLNNGVSDFFPALPEKYFGAVRGPTRLDQRANSTATFS
jgi:hypothetical protein